MSTFWEFWKANKDDCCLYGLVYALLVIITCVTWGTLTVYLCAILAIICTVLLIGDFLKWRIYYGRIHSDRG